MTIKIIPRSVHALLDYMWSGAFAASPKMFGFEDEVNAVKLCRVQGTLVAIASALTRYELGTLKIIPFRTHLKLDALGAVLGIASPWLLGFSHNKRARNTILAFFLFEAVAVLLSQTDEME
jgi:hypothetical protein